MMKKKLITFLSCCLLTIFIIPNSPQQFVANNDILSTRQVANYQALHDALLDVNVTEIILTKNISLENEKPLNIPARDLTINGSGYRLNEGNTAQSRIQLSATMALTLNNLNLNGNGKYGTFSVAVGVQKIPATITYNNCTYIGPQLVYNPHGTVIFTGTNDIQLTARQNVNTDIEEVGEVTTLIFTEHSEVNIMTTEKMTDAQHAVFWFRGLEADNALQIGKNAVIDIIYPTAFALFYQLNNHALILAEQANVHVQTENLLYGSLAFSEVLLEKNATFTFTTTNGGGLHSFGHITIHDGAILDITSGASKAPISLKNESEIVVSEQASLVLARRGGAGLFLEPQQDYKIQTVAPAEITTTQHGYTQTWHNLTADISFSHGKTSVITEKIGIDGELDLANSSFFKIAPTTAETPHQQTITYEKAVKKTVADFHNDLNLTDLQQGDYQFTSDYDETYVDAVGTYLVTVHAHNLTENIRTMLSVNVIVVDTTAPIISVADFVKRDGGISYYLPVHKTAENFLADIQARTDDGSPVTSNFNEVTNLTNEGSYEITLEAVDEYGNTATPKKINVTIRQLQVSSVHILQANNFSLDASEFEYAQQTNTLNNLMLAASNARVFEVNSNTISYDYLQSTITSEVTLEDTTTYTTYNTEISNSGLAEYKQVVGDAAQANSSMTNNMADKQNSFSLAKNMTSMVGIIVVVILLFVIYYLLIAIKQEGKIYRKRKKKFEK